MWIFKIYHHSCYFYGVWNLLRSSKSVRKNTGNLSAVYFCCSFGIFWESGTNIQKSLCQSLKYKTFISTFINLFILAYCSTTQDLAANTYQKITTIGTRTGIDGATSFYKNCYPWHIFKHILWKPKKVRYLKL